MTGVEPFIDPFASGLVGIVYETAKKVGGSFTQVVKNRQQAANALKKYADKYAARYGSIKLLGMQQSIELESVYTKVRFLDKLSIRQFLSVEEIEKTYRECQKRRFQTNKRATFDGFTVANDPDNQFLMVLGSPGVGKSTYLRRIGLEALKGHRGIYKYSCIPVMLELKRFNSSEIDIIKAITLELSNFGFPSSTEFAINLIEQGKLLILFDGLDEVPKIHLNEVVNKIQEFITKYDPIKKENQNNLYVSQNRYIASCRIAAYRSTWNRFRDIELADFDDDQIQQFIHNWFSSELDRQMSTSERCWQILNNPSNAASKELAQTPLLLTFLCLVYNRTQNFPVNRATLYRKALDILMEEWAGEKRITLNEIYQGLNIELEKVLLSEIAYNSFTNNQLFFTQQELIDQIKVFLSDTVDKPKYLNGKAVLDGITTQQGILVERVEDIYSFSHLTIQEYLTAQYVSQDSIQIEELLDVHLSDERWREVFILISGLIRNSDKMLELMEIKAKKKYINSKKLEKLLTWATQITIQSEKNYDSSVEKRIIAIFLFVTLNYAFYRIQNYIYNISYSEGNNRLDIINLALTRILSLAHTLKLDCKRELALELNIDRILTLDIDNSFPFIKDFNRYLFHVYTYINTIPKKENLGNINLLTLEAKLEAIKAKFKDDNKPLKIRQELAKNVYQAWIETLQIQQDLMILSTIDMESLADYLYVIELILNCKDTSIRISEKAWKKIDKMILSF